MSVGVIVAVVGAGQGRIGMKRCLWSFLVAHQVKDLLLTLQVLRSLLWCDFEPWPQEQKERKREMPKIQKENQQTICKKKKKKKKFSSQINLGNVKINFLYCITCQSFTMLMCSVILQDPKLI